jgi:hypothetical protein
MASSGSMPTVCSAHNSRSSMLWMEYYYDN